MPEDIIIIVLFALSLLGNLVGLALMAVAGFVCYRALVSNFALQRKIAAFDRFFETATEVLMEDTQFLRGSLAQKYLNSEIPEVEDMKRGLTALANHVVAIRQAVDELSSSEK